MKQKEFISVLKQKNISYYIENNQIIIINTGNVYLDSLTLLPENIVFNNKGNVYLYSLTSLPDNIVFNNTGYVNLYSIKEISKEDKYKLFKNINWIRTVYYDQWAKSISNITCKLTKI